MNVSVVGAKRSVANPGPTRTERLDRVMRHLEDFGDLGTVDEPGQFFRGLLPMRWGPAAPAEDCALAAIHQTNTTLRGPAQNVEFVAKRLLHGPSPYPEVDPRPDMTVLVGTPLYVALAD